MDAKTVLENVREISAQFACERGERLARRGLVEADFERLAEAGFLLTGVPKTHGGLWESRHGSIRYVCELLRLLAHGDPSVALVASMHPTVLSFWLGTPEAPEPFSKAWREQRDFVFETAKSGNWWGTITSEPGTGGDIMKTKAVASLDRETGEYRLKGQKHFGSGSGITSFMLTVALREGESDPEWFFMRTAGVPWDGSAGVRLVAEWDGHGMAATQSHGLQFEDFPLTQFAWPRSFRHFIDTAGGYIGCCFAAVILGVVETAAETARKQLTEKKASLRAYEQVEWARVNLEAWLTEQAYEGMLRANEHEDAAVGRRGTVLGKTAMAELAESALLRLCKVVGGGSYHRLSPFGRWYEDARALGFLRPPWPVAFDQLYEGSF